MDWLALKVTEEIAGLEDRPDQRALQDREEPLVCPDQQVLQVLWDLKDPLEVPSL